MTPRLDELYLGWLYSQVGPVEIANPRQTHWRLLEILYNKEFLWIIANDDNRAADGKELRQEFLDEEEIDDVDAEWMDLPCSMLELILGLAKRLSFMNDGEPHVWFWELIENLRLEDYNDTALIPEGDIEEEIHDILDDVIWRTYKPSGLGGLFPLRYTEQDQRIVELWYQLSAYLAERE
jgi:hypothetical protein